MNFRSANLSEVITVEPEVHRDERGFLARTFCEHEFSARGLNTRWPQHNHTLTLGRGSVRGLHWQAEPKPEIKLVRCVSGRVWDVVVDVRPTSPTFGQWAATELSSQNQLALYIPAGFAHGFQCLTDECELFYLMSEFYEPGLARGLSVVDAGLRIPWPLPVVNLSARDAALPALREIS